MNSTALEPAENADCPDSHAILSAGRRRETNSTPRHRNAETEHEVEIFTNAVNEDAYPEFYSKVKINVIPHPLTGRLPSGLVPQIATRKITQTPNLESGGSKQISGLRRWMSEVLGRQFYTSEVSAVFELGRKIPRRFDVLNNHNSPTEWAGFYANVATRQS
jgi:hypothetical protein